MENIISATMVQVRMPFIRDLDSFLKTARFAELCEQCKITFIGPPSNVIASLGNKQVARNTMAAGVPVIPGTQGDL